MSFQQPKVISAKSFPSKHALKADQALLIYDRYLLKTPGFKKWSSRFPHQYAVQSGEGLKQIQNFPNHAEQILRKAALIEKRPLRVIAVGGGSVGDFAGFVASILHRGVELIQIPSTWLAAIDSAHGGKTALNVSGFKNQLGSFHQASTIYLVEPLLKSQPEQRVQEALGEALKISLLAGGKLWSQFAQIKKWDHRSCWSLLPAMIAAKYQIVRKDPLEKKGLRHILNLGHTMGHVFESELSLPHGKAVLDGLDFAIHWSLQRRILKVPALQKMLRSKVFQTVLLSDSVFRNLRKISRPEKALKLDKKRAKSGRIRFIFIAGPGQPKIQEVSIPEILAEIRRQS